MPSRCASRITNSRVSRPASGRSAGLAPRLTWPAGLTCSAGGDAFGLVGNKGGRDLLGQGGSAYVWYAGLVKSQILEQLNTEKQARHGEYSMMVRVWVRNDGSIDRVRVVGSSGNRERDQAIEQALSRMGRLSQAPPADMPEPISLRIVSRG